MNRDASFLPNLRHLAATVAVLHRGSVSAAARAIHLTQPAVTQAVANIEAELGGCVFDRSAFGVSATPAGRRAGLRLERALEHVSTGLTEAGASRAEGGSRAEYRVTATQLKAVAEVAAAGGIASAARGLGTTRATLHRPVRELESTLGVALLEATSHGVRPTRAAQRLARRVHLAASEWLQARAEMTAESGVERGATVIGAMPLARSVIVPAAVLAFVALYPSHRIGVLDGPYESMLEALRHGRADWLVGALRTVIPEDVEQQPLFDDPLAVVARVGHAFVGRAHVSAQALRSQAWVAPRPHSPLRRRFDALIGVNAAAAPIECNSLVAARSILLASDRLMIASTHQVRHELDAGLMALINHPFGRLTRSIGITRRRDWEPTAAQKVLLALLMEEAHKAAQSAVDGEVSSPSRRRNVRGETPVARVKKREK